MQRQYSDQRDSGSLAAAVSAARFPLLLPRWLPPETSLGSFRWWNAGHAVEIHTATKGLPLDDQVTGQLTIKLWVGDPTDETRFTRIDGVPVDSDRAANGWRYSAGEPDVWYGNIDGTYVLASTVLAKEAAFLALESLAS